MSAFISGYTYRPVHGNPAPAQVSVEPPVNGRSTRREDGSIEVAKQRVS